MLKYSLLWLDSANGLPFELIQCSEEGKDTACFSDSIKQVLAMDDGDPGRATAAGILYDEMSALPVKVGYQQFSFNL